jgi:muramoyltetrapeptide carboxypeptidase
MAKSKSWEHLRPGDIVDVIAPASHSPLHKLESGCAWLKSVGLIPRVPKDLIDPEVFFAAPLATQLSHLKEALRSDSKAIWCLRGGYGSMRLIPELLKMKPTTPKAFLGFSDITALHLHFNQNWKWSTLHSRVLGQMSPEKKDTDDRKELENLLFGKIEKITIPDLIPMNEAAKKTSIIKGKITGGNLRIVQSSFGLSWQIKTSGKIVFFEDVDERGYSVHRMLEQLWESGLLRKGPKAVLFGDFTNGLEKDGKDHTLHSLMTFAQKVNYPVFRGIPSGHGEKLNHTLPFNTDSSLHTGKKAKLIIQIGCR